MGVPSNRWPLTLWNLLCLRSAIRTRNTGRGSDCTYVSGNRFRHLGWNKTPPTQNPRGWHEAGLGKLKPIPWDGPGCTAAAQASHPELLVQTRDGKKQSSPLCTSWGHCKAQNTGCVSQDSSPQLHWEVNPSQTLGGKLRARNQQRLMISCGVWWLLILLIRARQGELVGSKICRGFGRAASLLLLL